MLEKITDRKEERMFMSPGQIEIDIAIAKEKRKGDQDVRKEKIVERLSSKGIGDLEALAGFSGWGRTEREIASEIEDKHEYAEEQLKILLKEASFFETAGLESGKPELLKESLERLEGTEEAGYYDGALYDAQQKADLRIIDEKFVDEIRSKIKELCEKLGEMQK